LADNRSVSERSERRGELHHATAAGLPRSAPERLRRAARLASVRAALGDALGNHLVGLREEPGGVVLLLAGDGWERGLAPHLEELAGPVARALDAPLRPVSVESAPLAPRESPAVPPAPAAGGGADPGPGDPRERRARLAAAAERLAARFPDRCRG
jgi:hypothetical protein